MLFRKKSRLSWRLISLTLFLCLGATVCCMVSPSFALENNNFSLAPVNPDFTQYIQNLKVGKVQHIVDGRPTGYFPSPLNLPHLKGKSILKYAALYPATYDLRTLEKITPIKNQGLCGSCWTFATYASLESYLLPSATCDFSENNLKNTHGFDLGYSDGGNRDMSTAYLTRWSGPVSEADDPYNPNSGSSPSGLSPQKHIQDVYYIPDRGNSLDNDNIKQAIMDFGAIYTTMYWDDLHYRADTFSYYLNDTGLGSNHAVTIVGWDDNFPASNFATIAPGNGAFIVKNSWGTAWGQSGYFYISYYDTKVGTENTAFNNAEPTSNYSNEYQYDPLGWVDTVGQSGGSNQTCYGANIFTASTSESLAAVSTYTSSPNSTYELHIFKDVDDNIGPTSGTLAGSKTGTIMLPGYSTINLDTLVPLTSGQKFSIVIKLTTPGWGYPIPVEYTVPGYTSQATSNPKESWVSLDGFDWSDLTNIGYGNVCIKAFTTESANPVLKSVTADKSSPQNAPATIKWTCDATGPVDLQYAWYIYKDGVQIGTSSPLYSTSNYFSYNCATPGTYKIKVFVKAPDGTKVSKYSADMVVNAPAVTLAINSVTPDKTSPQSAPATVKWTCDATGPVGLQYAWYVYKDGVQVGTSSPLYSTNNYFSYNCATPGTYKVRAYAKALDGTKVSTYSADMVVNAPSVTLAINSVTPDKTSPQTATVTVKWTCNATGPAGLQYAWYVYKDEVKVATSSPLYSTDNYFSYNCATPGTYKVRAYAKAPDGTKVSKYSADMVVNQGTSLAINSVTSDKTSPQTAPVTVKWTCDATGPSGLQYAWYVYRDGVKVTASSPLYGVKNYFSYSCADPGAYKVKVFIKAPDGAVVSKYSADIIVNAALRVNSHNSQIIHK